MIKVLLLAFLCATAFQATPADALLGSLLKGVVQLLAGTLDAVFGTLVSLVENVASVVFEELPDNLQAVLFILNQSTTAVRESFLGSLQQLNADYANEFTVILVEGLLKLPIRVALNLLPCAVELVKNLSKLIGLVAKYPADLVKDLRDLVQAIVNTLLLGKGDIEGSLKKVLEELSDLVETEVDFKVGALTVVVEAIVDALKCLLGATDLSVREEVAGVVDTPYLLVDSTQDVVVEFGRRFMTEVVSDLTPLVAPVTDCISSFIANLTTAMTELDTVKASLPNVRTFYLVKLNSELRVISSGASVIDQLVLAPLRDAQEKLIIALFVMKLEINKQLFLLNDLNQEIIAKLGPEVAAANITDAMNAFTTSLSTKVAVRVGVLEGSVTELVQKAVENISKKDTFTAALKSCVANYEITGDLPVLRTCVNGVPIGPDVSSSVMGDVMTLSNEISQETKDAVEDIDSETRFDLDELQKALKSLLDA